MLHFIKYQKIIVQKNYRYLLLILVGIGGFVRFYNLQWAPVFVHPDETNIIYAISRLNITQSMHPDFFAYGSFPIYLAYFVGILYNVATGADDIWQLMAPEATLISRYLSAFLSTLLIPITYLITLQLLKSRQWAIINAFFTTFFIGFIQYAHFSTFEIFLTFLYSVCVLLALQTLAKPTYRNYVFLGLVIGTTIGTKVVSLYLLGLPVLITALYTIPSPTSKDRIIGQLLTGPLWKALLNVKTLISLALCGIIYFTTNPYTILALPNFLGSMSYESDVATGTLPVFYTRSFSDTIPFLYQLEHVFPFISGYLFTILAGIATIYYIVKVLTGTDRSHFTHYLFIYIFLGYTFFHSLMFVKWTRYMVPALPLFAMGLIYTLQKNTPASPTKLVVRNVLIGLLLLEVCIRGVSFFQIYVQSDSREQAVAWAKEHIPVPTTIIGEHRDTNIIPFNPHFGQYIVLFNFYELHQTSIPEESSLDRLVTLLEQADYIIMPSQRVYNAALKHAEKYPLTANFYTHLFAGNMGFSLIYSHIPEACILPQELPHVFRTWLCPINYLDAEETFTVFDHPPIKMYKKTQPFTADEYRHRILP